jgi:nitroreductase
MEANMEFFECVESRRSVRAYKSDQVEGEKLERVLEAGRLAPTASNKQPFSVFVLHTEGREPELRKIYDKDWFVAAPIVLLVCSVPGEAWVRKDGKNYADADATIAMDHMIMTATGLGLGSCWVANFDAKAAREIFKLEEGWEPLVFTPLGYPKETPAPRPRKKLESIVIRP